MVVQILTDKALHDLVFQPYFLPDLKKWIMDRSEVEGIKWRT